MSLILVSASQKIYTVSLRSILKFLKFFCFTLLKISSSILKLELADEIMGDVT